MRALKSEKGIVLAIAATFLVVLMDEVTSKKTPVPADFIGAAGAAILLTFLAGPAPQLARPLAVLVFVAVLYKRGPRLFKHLGLGKPATVTDLKGKRNHAR